MTTHTEETIEPTEGGPQRLADAAGDIAEQATSVAEQRASSTMTQVGDTIEQVARAVRNTGEQLRSDQPQLAGLADTAAEQAEHAAQFLRQHDARDVLDEVQDFARRQPAVIVGAGLALGLLVGRAIKSAGPSGQRGFYGGAPLLGQRPRASTARAATAPRATARHEYGIAHGGWQQGESAIDTARAHETGNDSQSRPTERRRNDRWDRRERDGAVTDGRPKG